MVAAKANPYLISSYGHDILSTSHGKAFIHKTQINTSETYVKRGECVDQQSLSVVGPKNTENLPSQVDNSTKPYLPPLIDQYVSDSYTSFAVTYYMATNQIAKARNWTNVTEPENQLSPQFTYVLSDENSDPVSSLERNLIVLKEHGTPKLNKMPLKPDNDITWPSREQWRAALENRITDYGYLTAINTEDGLCKLKSALNEGNVLAFATYLKSWDYFGDMRSIENKPGSEINSPYRNERIVTKMNNDQQYGRAMAIVGYNDDIWVDINRNGIMEDSELGALKIITSRGPSFANAGYIWIAYDALRDDPINDHPCIFCNCRAAYIKADASPYQPKVTAEITVNTDDREQLKLYAGVNWDKATEPCVKSTKENIPENDYSARYRHDQTLYGRGGNNAYHGTIILDMTDYAKTYGFYDPIEDSFKPGDLTFSVGIGDSPTNMRVESISFIDEIHCNNITCDMNAEQSANNSIKWFSGKLNLSGKTAPDADPSLKDLITVQADSLQPISLDTSTCEARIRFIPDTTAVYTVSSGSRQISLEILNNANQVLYKGNTLRNGSSVIRVRLLAGETYVMKISGKEATATMLKVTQYSQMQSEDTGMMNVHVDNGILSPLFDTSIMDYKVALPKDNGIVQIDAEAKDPGAIILIDGLLSTSKTINISEGSKDNPVRLDVIAPSGDTETYTVQFSRPEWPPSKDATLSNIELSQGHLAKPFSSKETSSTVILDENQDHVIITPVKTDIRATVYINNILQDNMKVDVGNGQSLSIKVKVKSQIGNTSKTYIIKVTRDKSKNNRLKPFELSVGKLDQEFNPNLFDYTVHIDDNTPEVTIKAYAENSLARISPSLKTVRLDTGASKKVTFRVKAQSGATRPYTVTVIRAASKQDGLKSLQATPSFTPLFSSDNTKYVLNLNDQASCVTIKAIKIDNHAIVFIGSAQRTSQKIKVQSGQTIKVEITVKAQAGNKRTYTITIIKP